MSLCPTPGLAPVKSPLREIFDNPAYSIPAAVSKRAEFFLFFADVIYPMFDPSLLVVFRETLAHWGAGILSLSSRSPFS